MSSPIISLSPPTEDDQTDKVVCKLCRRQFAKYTCPRCNVPYCSLTCFRGDAHSQCSEPFYKKELETAIHKEPSKTAEERAQMLQVLKRFEEESLQEEEEFKRGGEEESELAARLASVDLDSAAPEELWEALTPAQKKKFLDALNNPSSELAQQLLASEELQTGISEPWWTSLDEHPIGSPLPGERPYPPTRLNIPASLLKPVAGRPLLAYNLAAIGITYAYIVRHLGVASLAAVSPEDPGFQEPYTLIARFIPFLLDRRSTLVFPNLDGVITDLASRFDSHVASNELFPILLQDAHRLVCPLDIVDYSPSLESDCESLNSHPHQLPLLVLSDLKYYLSALHESRQGPQKLQPSIHKLLFYAAHVVTMPTPILRGLAHELRQKQIGLRNDLKQSSTTPVMKPGRPSQSMAGRIEDLSGRVPGSNDL